MKKLLELKKIMKIKLKSKYIIYIFRDDEEIKIDTEAHNENMAGDQKNYEEKFQSISEKLTTPKKY